MNTILEELNKLFGEVEIHSNEILNKAKTPILVNVSLDNDIYTVEAALAGVKKENISIMIEDENLIINVKEEVNNKKYLTNEIRSNYLSRTIELEGINKENVRARYENGILIVELLKTTIKPTTIEIE